jgi:hypothetical protein
MVCTVAGKAGYAVQIDECRKVNVNERGFFEAKGKRNKESG